MKQPTLDQLLSDLGSQEVEVQMAALVTTREVIASIVDGAVQGLLSASQPYKIFVAEELCALGPIVVGPVEGLLQRNLTAEEQILCSMILLDFGSQVGVANLLSAVEPDNEYMCLVASKLAEKKIEGSASKILLCLSSLEINRVDEICSLVHTMKTSNMPLPQKLLDRFLSTEAPYALRRRVAKLLQK
jgi:hypothetical protein